MLSWLCRFTSYYLYTPSLLIGNHSCFFLNKTKKKKRCLLSLAAGGGRQSEEAWETRTEAIQNRPEGEAGAEPAECQRVPGQEEAEIPVPGGAGIQSGESYLCTPGGTGNGKVCQQQDKRPLT